MAMGTTFTERGGAPIRRMDRCRPARRNPSHTASGVISNPGLAKIRAIHLAGSVSKPVSLPACSAHQNANEAHDRHIWNLSTQAPSPASSTLVFTNSSAGHGKTKWMVPPRASMASRNRMSEPEAALANPIPAFMAASCFSRSSLISGSFAGGKRGVRRSGASIIWPEKTTSLGLGNTHQGIGAAVEVSRRESGLRRVEERARRLSSPRRTRRDTLVSPFSVPKTTSASLRCSFQ